MLTTVFTPADTSNYLRTTNTVLINVHPASTVGLASASTNPALPNQSVTLSYVLSSVSPGAGTPTGTVRFKLDGVHLANASLSGGEALFTTSAIGLGNHTVVAEYAGDGNFNGVTNALDGSLIVNTPPTAVADSVVRYSTNGFKVSISTLLGNDTESDANDTIRLTSVSPTSALGGTVISNGLWIYYTPPTSSTNTDTFNYTIADTLGGSSTGTVTITTRIDSAPSFTLKITGVAGGDYLIQFDGIPDSTYDIETTPTLTPANWQYWMTTNTDAAGMMVVTDNVTNGAPARFYRTVHHE